MDEYCFEETKKNAWILKICSGKNFWRNTLHFFSTTLCLFIMSFVIFVYGFFKDLRDTYGKCLIALLISQIIMNAAMPILRIDSSWENLLFSIISIGFIFTKLWFSAMCFHHFWSIKYEKF